MPKLIPTTRLLVVIGLLGLLVCGYALRFQVLGLVNYLIDAREVIAENALQDHREGQADREKLHEARVAYFETQILEMYDTIEKFKKGELPPSDPPGMRDPRMMTPQISRPVRPRPLEVTERLVTINSDLRQDRTQYFKRARALNWLVCLFATMVAGGLTILILYDRNGPTLGYVLLLVVSFVFLIGPALYSWLTYAAYRMPEPQYQEAPYSYPYYQY